MAVKFRSAKWNLSHSDENISSQWFLQEGGRVERCATFLLMTSLAAVIRDALSWAYRPAVVLLFNTSRNPFYPHVQTHLLTSQKWSNPALYMHDLHNKQRRTQVGTYCSRLFIISFQTRMSKSWVYDATHTDIFAIWVRRHPLIGKMLPVTLYWHFSLENTRPGKHKHWLARRALALMLRWDHSPIRFPSYFSGWLD